MSGMFNFRLQKVLEYREDREKDAQNKLASAEISLRQSLAELTCLKDELTEVFNGQQNESGRLDLNSRLLHSRYTDYLAARICSGEETVQQKETVVKTERRQLEHRMQERKILSSLKEKQTTAFELESKLQEQKVLDEFAITGFSRRQSY